MWTSASLWSVLPVIATTALVTWMAWQPFGTPPSRVPPMYAQLPDTVRAVDHVFEARWQEACLEPADEASDLKVLRRLSLALVGTIPSLEEVRAFQADARPDRLSRWADRFIADWRFVEFFGDRLAVALVNDADTEFRDSERQRFVEWLGREIQGGRAYDELVRAMIAERGLWADRPAVLFIRSELVQNDLVPERLAARASRSFLGQQIGCAQCHDHPFADWTQHQFAGLAAYFAAVRHSRYGIQDTQSAVLVRDGQQTDPAVPFQPQHLPAEGTARERLAEWMTHNGNRRFRRAIANRVWALMFGRPYLQPVDDISDPPAVDTADAAALLDLLGDDLAEHGYDLRRLIQVIASSRAFRLASKHPLLDRPEDLGRLQDAWAVFPLTQLTSQQLMRSLRQASSLKTLRIREEANTYTYIWSREQMRQAIERYGEAGDVNKRWQTGSLNQAVVRLVGRDFAQASKSQMGTATGRISAMASNAEDCLRACYLVCLTRWPEEVERTHFIAQLDQASSRTQRRTVEDLFWTLFNSPEFTWNH